MDSAFMQAIDKRVLEIALVVEKDEKAYFTQEDLDDIRQSYHYSQSVDKLKSRGAIEGYAGNELGVTYQSFSIYGITPYEKMLLSTM